jgi:hypothetical protein
VQNLCKDMSMAQGAHPAVAIMKDDSKVGRVDLEDCLLENMLGACMFWVRPAA